MEPSDQIESTADQSINFDKDLMDNITKNCNGIDNVAVYVTSSSKNAGLSLNDVIINNTEVLTYQSDYYVTVIYYIIIMIL